MTNRNRIICGSSSAASSNGGRMPPLLPRRPGFTLIELMITMCIIVTLAACSIAAMAASQDAARKDKTRALIAELHSLVMQKCESYREPPAADPGAAGTQRAMSNGPSPLRRPAPTHAAGDAGSCWSDFMDPPIAISNPAGGTITWPVPPSITLAYQNAYNAVVNTPAFTATIADPDNPTNGTGPAGNFYASAKCLYLFISMGSDENDVLENFSQSDIGDPTNSGMNCFLDAWGKPIQFLRWAPGFVSNLQLGANGTDPDQTDPLGVYGKPPTTYALYPLIYSAGPDGIFDITYDSSTAFRYSKHNNDPFSSVSDTGDFPSNVGPIGTQAINPPSDSAIRSLGCLDNLNNHTIGTH